LRSRFYTPVPVRQAGTLPEHGFVQPRPERGEQIQLVMRSAPSHIFFTLIPYFCSKMFYPIIFIQYTLYICLNGFAPIYNHRTHTKKDSAYDTMRKNMISVF
jgi:hypothetical protein